ncbi:hypothetical protein NHU_00850 [Rhodovulum sulfidophilum]|uniref:Uncharacterized protein n=1 Tax=Rhodovulum sulfidophilum TaxID=35806 RepID=A0A0D6AYM5_RHOSU|nr:hypothetical protein NHU_00850 [Rhodovulum sulfidophilum]
MRQTINVDPASNAKRPLNSESNTRQGIGDNISDRETKHCKDQAGSGQCPDSTLTEKQRDGGSKCHKKRNAAIKSRNRRG